MFWSKIWFFLIAVAGALALTIALVLPRPAARKLVTEERNRLTVACGVVNILLADNARKRVETAALFARHNLVVNALVEASSAPAIDELKHMKPLQNTVADMIDKTKGGKPSWAMMVDKRGRVVARANLDANEYGDVVAGRPLVDDALAGYLRDDVWVFGSTMYFVAASPVVRAQTQEYVGAMIVGHGVTSELASSLVKSQKVELGFYLGTDSVVAGSQTIALDQKALLQAYGQLKDPEIENDCRVESATTPLTAQKESLLAKVARLPGEAGNQQAFFAVYIKRPVELGFSGTLDSITKDDLGTVPWVLVIAGFLAVLGGGIGLMLFEADRPLRRLTTETVRLAKGDIERLSEDAHPGKFGSIARSVNIHIDKLGREAKTAKNDLDQLLGPAPEGSLGTIDLLATALPAARPGGPATAVPPPPSEFRFGDSGPTTARPTPPPRPAIPPRPATPPQGVPKGASAPVSSPTPSASIAPLTLDDDILGTGGSPAAATSGDVDPYFKQVFDQFVAVKKSCGEPTTGMTYEKFAEKLVRNRDELRVKTGAKEVRFTVYVKDGKAALKATPVKDE